MVCVQSEFYVFNRRLFFPGYFMTPDTTPGLLMIDLDAVAANYRAFRQSCAASCAVAGVVKADAYGLGMAQVAPVLAREGCRQFFVATVEEGIALRSLTDHPVYILGGLWQGAEDDYIARNLTPVLNSLEEIERWRDRARRSGRKLPALLHFDTGMNRLGLGADEVEKLMADSSHLEGIDVRFVMSHFACADERDHAMTVEQAARFETAAARFPGIPRSLANSSGAFRDKAWHYDMIRPGMGLYGLNPLPEQTNPMRPAVRLATRLLQVRHAQKGETAGYGATYRFAKKTRLGTVALGYADGFLRAGGNRAQLYYRDTPCPIVGRVSMDLIIVDLGDAQAVPGDRLEIIGPHQDADALAASLGTIGYEVLTGLGRRWKRAYVL